MSRSGVRLVRSSLLRPLISHPTNSRNPKSVSHLIAPSPPPQASPPPPLPRLSSSPFLVPRRSFASSPSPASMVPINSQEGYSTAINKAQDDKFPTIFYFTAVWCGPCKFISPKFVEMSQKFPHVATYKIDIDQFPGYLKTEEGFKERLYQEGLGSILSKLRISAVPTFHFYQNGKKAAEVIGADIAQIKETMENLYKID